MTKEVLSAIQDAVGTQVFGIWFLIGAAFVIFHAGWICNGRGRIHQSEECRQYYYEEPDGHFV